MLESNAPTASAKEAFTVTSVDPGNTLYLLFLEPAAHLCDQSGVVWPGYGKAGAGQPEAVTGRTRGEPDGKPGGA